jgi:hypothetical protein
MSSPVVSIIMGVFNGERFLAETLEGVLSQSFRDFEFIIVDDGSTDATGEILAKYAKRDNRIRVLAEGKLGRSASLNLAIRSANGKYVANTDADDVSMPGRIAEQVVFMERNPDVGVLGSAHELISEAGTTIDVVRHPLKDSQIRSVLLRYNPICHSSAMFRRNIALSTSGYRCVFEPSEDYDLWLRLSEYSKLANLDAVLVRYRLHANQLSVRKVEHQTLCVLAASVAAERRRSGKADPFDEIHEMTPQIVESLGVTPQEMRARFADAYDWWSARLQDINPRAALELIEKLTQLSQSDAVEPGILGDSLVRAARIRYKQKERAKALSLAGRAFLLSPDAMKDKFMNRLRRTFRGRLWHPFLNVTRPVSNAAGLRRIGPHSEMKQHSNLAIKKDAYDEWADREFAAPSPQAVKQVVLLRNGLRDATWIETGTYLGETTAVLSTVAKIVYSIEPEPSLFSNAEQKFKNTSNVKIIKGLSEDVLPQLLPAISGDICFWLDGHYSAGITFKGPQDTPIIDELAVIGRAITNACKFVVMVDDVRCFNPKHPEFTGYPSVDVLIDWAREHRLTWHIEHDIFIAKNY